MKKFGLVIAALATIAVAAPSMASAETIIVKRGGGHHDGWRARAMMHRDHGMMHRDHGWHRGPHRDRVMVIKRHRY